jgi:hypothetical protein
MLKHRLDSPETSSGDDSCFGARFIRTHRIYNGIGEGRSIPGGTDPMRKQ